MRLQNLGILLYVPTVGQTYNVSIKLRCVDEIFYKLSTFYLSCIRE